MPAHSSPTTAFAHRDTRVHQVNLVSDQAGKAAIQDTNLVNAWGLSVAPNGASPIWVANNGTDTSTLYSGSTGAGASPFMKVPLTVSVAGAPTGTVFNTSTGFAVNDGMGHSAPSRFLFATESGTILGWNPTVPPSSAMPPAPSTMAFVIASEKDAIYKGLTMASDGMSTFLYAADFHNNRIAVWDQSGMRLWWKGAFHDRMLPTTTRRSTSRSSAASSTSATRSRTPPDTTRSPAPAAGSSTSTASTASS